MDRFRTRLGIERLEERETPSPIGGDPVNPLDPGTQPAPAPTQTPTDPAPTSGPTG